MSSEDDIPPFPKRMCLDPEGLGVRCSTPVPSVEETLDLNDQSFETFIEEVEDEQEEAIQNLSQHELDESEDSSVRCTSLQDTLILKNESFESLTEEEIENKREGDAVLQELSQHGLDDESFSGFLQDVAADATQPVVSASENFVVGSSQSEGATVNGLVFPKEVLENIFCRLRLVDLYTSTCRVCRLWNSIVTAQGFSKWKKLYHKTKRDPDKAPSMDYGDNSSLLYDIARFAGKEFHTIKTPLKPVLKKHSQHSCVSQLAGQYQIDGAVPTLSDLEELVLLIACCKSIHQLLHLVRLLSCPMEGGFSGPALSYLEISEFLYCLAVLFRKATDISSRFHYFVYYVLDVMERRAAVRVELDEPDGVSASAAKLTNEQLRIVNHDFQPEDTVKVIALAGTGKTTTLYHIARSNPKLRILYCVFNKSVQQYAKNTIFADCENVQAKTLHSLAFPHTGFMYKGRIGDLTAFSISWKIKSKEYKNKKWSLAMCVRDTLNNYFASADEELESQHVISKNETDDFPTAVVLSEAQHYWECMQSSEKKIWMCHDGYLKLYQLQKPMNLSKSAYGVGPDIILVDEAQDLSPAVIDILSRQTTAKVYVGDPNQQIYSFRGATNALNQIDATHTYTLTRSFRFGPEISFACELALSFFKPKKAQILIGTTEEGSISGGDACSGQKAVICRLNSTLFDEVVKILKEKPNASIGFAAAAEKSDLNTKYHFNTIEDIAALKRGVDVSSLKTSEIKWSCKSFTDLVTRAKKTGDKSLMGRIKVVEKYDQQIPSLMKRIRERVTFNMEDADVVFSTAHRSKGLEFETVIVADDFTPDFNIEIETYLNIDGLLIAAGSKVVEVDEDERNLVYVAMSRAKKNLVLSPSIWGIVSKKEFLFATSSLGVCTQCGRSSEFLLKRPAFHLSGGKVEPEARLCTDCCRDASW